MVGDSDIWLGLYMRDESQWRHPRQWASDVEYVCFYVIFCSTADNHVGSRNGNANECPDHDRERLFGFVRIGLLCHIWQY